MPLLRAGVSRRFFKIYCLLALIGLLGAAPLRSQQAVETPEQTNERIRQLAATASARSVDPPIGSGDLLRIDVFDVPELSREVRVSDSGYISLPLLPMKVRAGGLTAFQLEEKLQELLQANELILHPQVSVFVKEQNSQPITVIGAVKQPKVFQAVRPTTLLEVLSEAGGLADDAGGLVIVTHAEASSAQAAQNAGTADVSGPPPQATMINLHDLLDSGDAKFNIPLRGGDVVSVPRGGIVYVLGAVERQGGYVLQNEKQEMTSLKVLSLAGGLTGTARPSQAVILRKESASGERREIPLDLKKVMARQATDVRLMASDILYVPNSGAKKLARGFVQATISAVPTVALYRALQ